MSKLLLKRAIIVIAIEILCFIAVYFPYPFFAKFMFKTISDIVIYRWDPRMTQALNLTFIIPAIKPVRLAFTAWFFVGILIFLLLQKLAAIAKTQSFSILRKSALICSWYCLLVTCIEGFVVRRNFLGS